MLELYAPRQYYRFALEHEGLLFKSLPGRKHAEGTMTQCAIFSSVALRERAGASDPGPGLMGAALMTKKVKDPIFIFSVPRERLG